jgi:predicted outer membrane repeat protein
VKNRTCAFAAPVSRRVSHLFALLKLVVCFAMVAGISSSVFAQVTQLPVWTQQSPSTIPPARSGATMAYDAASGQLVLFGGDGDDLLNDTWTWNGSTWTQQSPSSSPPVRYQATMAYDAASGQVVLFGGFNGSTELGDTWTWNGSTWTQQSPTASPPARYLAAMTYDAASGQMVLFGGLGNSGSGLNDTWTWNGSTWTQQSPSASPPGRYGAAMAYDAASGQMVLFGGGGNSGVQSDTWTWNGSTWTQQSPSASPPARYLAGMAYDAGSGQAALFGGSGNSGFLSDTWMWNGSTWTEPSVSGGPPASQDVAMAYDAASGRMVLFGGLSISSGNLNDTWTLQVGPLDVGMANVCPSGATTPPPCSQSGTVSFSVAAGTTIGSINILTQGVTTNVSGSPLDFNATSPDASATLCKAQTYASATTCTVDVTFAPQLAGMRNGAVVIEDSSGAVLATTYIYGTGDAPQVTYNQNYNPSATNLLGASFSGPQGVAVDAHGDVFVADSTAIKEMTPGCASAICAVPLASGSGVLSTNLPGLAVDGAGNVFVADYGGNKVEEILAAGGYTTVNTLGGSFTFGSPTGVAVDGSGNVYVADYNNNAVEEILAASGYSTVIPMGGGFAAPQGVAVDGSGNVYVADTNNNAIKEMPAGCASISCVTTLGGSFSGPTGVAVSGTGLVYVGDTGSNLLQEMPAGCASSSCVATLGGSFNALQGVAVDGNGNVYVADTNNVEVKQLDYVDPPILPAFATTTDVGSTDTTDGPQTVTLANIGNEPLILTTTESNPNYPSNFPENTADPFLCGTSRQILAGASCDLSANFAPTSGGLNLGTMALTDNALNVETLGIGSAMQSLALSGTGVAPPPTITAVSPSYGPLAGGTTVTITGTNLTNAVLVLFGSSPVSAFSEAGGNVITTVAPAGAGTVNITVTTLTGTSPIGPQDQFTYLQTFAPFNSSLNASPATLTAGASTTITAAVQDISGNQINGAVVNFAVTSASGKAVLSTTSATTVDGLAAVTLTDSVVETATVSASVASPYSGTLNTATATFVAPAYVVTVATDTTTGVPGNCINPNLSTAGNTNCSLRDAVAAANALAGVSTNISFSPASLSGPQTITLVNGQLNLTANATITGTATGSGSSLTNLVTLSGNNASRILSILNSANAVIGNLTLTNGTASSALEPTVEAGGLTRNNAVFSNNAAIIQGGGAITVAANATLAANSCTFANNSSATFGGAIRLNSGATATLRDSTFSGNTAATYGGAIASTGTLQITNSTFTANAATSAQGGAIYTTQGALTVTQTTMVGNSSSTYGGAVFHNSGSLILKNSFIIGNTSGSYPDIDPNINGDSTLVDDGGNIANEGTSSSTLSANLTSLNNYGGSTQTMVPLPGSPAICAATSANATGITTDQRGLPRTTTYGNSSCVDAGAVQTNYSLSFTTEPAPISPATAISAGANFNAAVTLDESGSPFAPAVSIPLTLTGGGTLTNGTATTANGIANYPTLQVTAVGAADTLTANLALNGTLTPPLVLSAVSSSFAVEQVTATTAVASATLTQGHEVTAFTPVTGSGGTAPLTYSVSPALPAGLSLNLGAGTITGTPTGINSAATYTVTVTDANSATATATFSLTINSALAATSAVPSTLLPVNESVSAFTPVTVTGGTTPLTYSISPTLPSGLSLNATSGAISGTPTVISSATTYTVTVTDANGATATANFTLQVGQLLPVISWNQPGAINYGTTLGSILGVVAQSSSTTVAGSTVYTATATTGGSIAVTSATVLPAGTYTLSVTFTPTNTTVYKSATSSVSLTVNKILPSVILNLTPNPVLVQNTVTLTATVSSVVSSPTGAVSFYDASSTTPLGSSPVSAGVAVLPVSTLTVGSHSITAIYSGDTNFVTQTSSPVPETVQDFSLNISTSSGSTPTQTVVPGGIATYTLVVSPVDGSTFPAPVSFTASGLPTGAVATFTPQTLATGSGTTNVTLSIQTPTQIAKLQHDRRFGGGFVPVALGMLLLPFSRRLRRSAKKLGRGGSLALLLLMSLGAMAGLTGCGTSSGFFDQSPQNYVVTVTATSGALQHTTTVTLNLQ